MPSYSPVFSTVFILYTDETPNVSFEVPAGFTAVVRHFSCYTGIGDELVNCYIDNPESGAAVTIASLSGIGINEFQQWSGRVVAPEGYTINISSFTEGASDQIYVGGYLLRNALS